MWSLNPMARMFNQTHKTETMKINNYKWHAHRRPNKLRGFSVPFICADVHAISFWW
jgi:hypothetical protein